MSRVWGVGGKDLAVRVWFRVWCLGWCLGFGVKGLVFRVWCLWFGVQDLGFRICGVGLEV